MRIAGAVYRLGFLGLGGRRCVEMGDWGKMPQKRTGAGRSSHDTAGEPSKCRFAVALGVRLCLARGVRCAVFTLSN